MKTTATKKKRAKVATTKPTSTNNNSNEGASASGTVDAPLSSHSLPIVGKVLSAKSVYEAAKKAASVPLKAHNKGTARKKSVKSSVKRKIKECSRKAPTAKKFLEKIEESLPGAITVEVEPADKTSDQPPSETSSDSEFGKVEDDSEPVVMMQETDADQEAVYQTLDQFDFILGNTTAALAFIPFQTCFYFKGRLNVTVISGIAEIQGYNMEANPDQIYQAFSPRGYSLQCIRSVGKSSILTKSAITRSVQPLLKNHEIECEESLLKQKSTCCTLLLLQSFNNSGKMDYLSRLWPSNLLRREECVPPTWDNESRTRFTQLCARLDVSIILRGAVFSARFYQQPDIWSDYTQQLISKAESKKEPIRLMLCGGKGVGKSTLLRYTVNRFIKSFGTVLVVDFDPGQPELFPTGCVSASMVSEPLLGPNFTHFQQTRHSYFVGDADITTCPDRYVRSCRQLLNDCRMDPLLASTPMVVNTMGFTTGVGLDVTLDLIRLVQPLQVIQLSSRSIRRNFPALLERDYVVQNRRGWLTDECCESLPDYSLEVIYSAAELSEKSLEEWGFRPVELRNIGLISYFSRMSDGTPEWSLADAVPHRISWQGLAVCICHESIPPELTMAALNASLVALCIMDSGAAGSVPRYRAVEGQYPTILQGMPLMPCLGYGVVRAIDVTNGHIYLVTPEPADRLAQVNCLVMGGIRLPEGMLLDAPQALRRRHGTKESGLKSRVPYATFGPSASQPACRPYRKYNPVFTLRNQM